MIHIIGDSHVKIFNKHPNFKCHYIPKATANNLHKEYSTSNSHHKLYKLLDRLNKELDQLLLSFGEIDCRLHVYYQSIKRKESIDQIIKSTITNYGKVLKDLKDQGFQFFLLGIPPCGYQGNYYNIPFFPDKIVQAQIYLDYNNMMIQYCNKHGYRYLDIYSKTVNEEGLVQKDLLKDRVHLNGKIIPIVEELIKNA